MCEVTSKNFEEIYPQVIDDLQSATYISIDCEFSGLFDVEFIYSLFDWPEARFRKLQNSLKTVKIIQFGISTFKYESLRNEFTVATYCFYIKPSPALKNADITFQVDSIDFLCKNKFNFNKLFSDGIFYLNKTQEGKALSLIEDRSLMNCDSDEIMKYYSKISEWSRLTTEGNEMILELTEENKTFVYVLHRVIRERFSSVWTFFAGNNTIIIRKVNVSEREALSTREEDDLLKQKLLDSILGFSKIIKEIERLKKPIIGHNMFIDLILIYKQFFNPSTVSYKNFKSAITKIFPIIYDTKFMSFRLRELLPRDCTWTSNCLSVLYSYLKDGKGSTIVIYTPVAKHRDKDFAKGGHFHDAGYDSYCTGFCFLKMAHMFSLWDEKKRSFHLTTLQISSRWLLAAVKEMQNRVNLSRAQVNYVVLDGEDPSSIRPSLMYIYSKTKEPLDVSRILAMTAKFATVDVQLLSDRSGLIATGNFYQARDIQEKFKNHSDYAVTKYSFIKHSKSGKTIMSGTVILSFFIIGFLISSRWR